jgi:hypothetical protein
LVDLAQRSGVPLRQSYRRVAKRAAIIGRPRRFPPFAVPSEVSSVRP